MYWLIEADHLWREPCRLITFSRLANREGLSLILAEATLKTSGSWLLIIGAAWALFAFNSDTTVYVDGPFSKKVHNAGLMDERRNLLFLAPLLVVVGVILVSFGNTRRTMSATSETSLAPVSNNEDFKNNRYNGERNVTSGRYQLFLTKKFAIVSLLFLSHPEAFAVTFEDLRSDLLGNEVVILGDVSQSEGCAKDWSFVDGDVSAGFKFRTTSGLSVRDGCVPKSLIGQRGIVLSVDLDPKILFKQTEGKNAFGDQIIKSKVPNQFTIVVVRIIGDGAQIGIKSFPNTIWEHNLRLVKEFQASNSDIETNLKKLLGRNIYHNGYTQLLPTWVTTGDLADGSKIDSFRDRDTKNLTILKVVGGKHLAVENAVVVKLQLPDGDERLLFGSLKHYNLKRAYVPTIMERLGVRAAEGIPGKFSQEEIAAIKKGSIFRGMSEDALYWSIGYPKNYNDWGVGGMQLIYGNGRFVYLRKGFVADWQSLSF